MFIKSSMKAADFLKKKGIVAGDAVRIEAGGTAYKGNVVNADGKFIALKLLNGYNTGIEAAQVKAIKKLPASEMKHKKAGKAEKKSFAFKEGLPEIAILHTGGTIASRVDYRTGSAVSAFEPEDLITMFPELAEVANIRSALITNMWSDDLRFAHFGIIAKAVESEIKRGCEGVIIGIGTDNLAVAAAGLSFALGPVPVPVLFVGAQRSSDRGSSDAAMNLICAARFITKSDFAGVAICMHSSTSDNSCDILPACRARKLHTSARDAFKAVNSTPIAKVRYDNGAVELIAQGYAKKDASVKVELKEQFEDKVGLLKVHVNMFPEEFEFYLKQKYRGLVIEGTGLGHTPGHVPTKHCAPHKKIMAVIGSLVKSGCIVVMASQCLYGRVNMNVYDKGRDLIGKGVISGEDMLPETAFVKLAWLLGNYSPEEAKGLVGKNLRGELSERTLG
jgi:glutamyl-tRNA(Gln) amidotransferase subunit D